MKLSGFTLEREVTLEAEMTWESAEPYPGGGWMLDGEITATDEETGQPIQLTPKEREAAEECLVDEAMARAQERAESRYDDEANARYDRWRDGE